MAITTFPQVETQLNARRLNIQTLQATVTNLQGQISNLQTALTTAQGAITTLQSDATQATTTSGGADGTWNGSAVLYKLASIFAATVTFSKSIILSFLSTAGPVHCSATGVLTTGAINLTSEVTGALPVANGGTGLTASPITVALGGTGVATLTSGSYLKGNGTGAVALQAAPIPVSDGGTGATSLTTYGVLTGNGGSAIQANASVLEIAGSTIGFWGNSPAAVNTLSAYTPNAPSPYSGIATGVTGTPYASVANLNDLQVSYNNLRAMCEDLRTKLQATGFLD